MLITIDTKNDYYQKLDVKIKACLEDIKKDYLLKHSPIADKKIKLKK
jgi:hypothetical protein